VQPIVFIVVLVLDQVHKWQAGPSTENAGLAFGLGGSIPGARVAFIALGLLVLALLWQQTGRERALPRGRFAWALILAGVAGNLIDRIRVGAVIDPIHLAQWFPDFNIADIAIVTGVLLLVGFSRTTK
jgi:signal peptidase II